MDCTKLTVFLFAWCFTFLTATSIERAENATQLPPNTTATTLFAKLGLTKTTTASNTKDPQTEDTNAKTDNGSVECESLTERETLYAVRIEIATANITASEWMGTCDESFRREIAAVLISSSNSSNISFSRSDIKHVKHSPTELANNTLLVSIFLRDGKIDQLNKAQDEESEGSAANYGTETIKGYEIMRNAVEEARKSLACNITINDIKSGLNCQTANSLFDDYFELWIALIAVGFLLILFTGLLTWCCCRRRAKSVHLKAKTSGLPSTDELKKIENGGLDNPAMTGTDEESPEKKKKTQAPPPPPVAPDMTTFGKGETDNNDKESQYDTGIVPYEVATVSPPESEKPSVENMELQDTKL